MKALLLITGVHVGWLSSVLGAARGYPWLGPVVILVILALHVARSRHGWGLSLTAVLIGGVGYLADTLLVSVGVLGFPSQATLGSPGSVWMTALWMNLAPAVRAMTWLRGCWPWMGLAGFIAGPLAYLSGERLGAVTFPAGAVSGLVWVGFEWMLAMPLLLWISSHTSKVVWERSRERCGST